MNHTQSILRRRLMSAARHGGVMLMLLTAIFGLNGFGQEWDVITFSHRYWKDKIPALACQPEEFTSDSAIVNFTYVFGDLPSAGYPLHYALVAGINDTLHADIKFNNRTDKDFNLTGTDYEHWFAPVVYPLSAAPGFPPLRDSTELGYRIRGWYAGGGIQHPAPTKLPARAERYSIKMDIWNLPEGRFQLCIVPTGKIPAGVGGSTGGDVFQYYPPQTLADSTNGYEGNFWRAHDDSNFTAAAIWADTILAINPSSVPGWWLKAVSSFRLGDTLDSKTAFEKALTFLLSGADPAMPDSTKRPLMQIEKAYLENMKAAIEFEIKYFNYNGKPIGP